MIVRVIVTPTISVINLNVNNLIHQLKDQNYQVDKEDPTFKLPARNPL